MNKQYNQSEQYEHLTVDDLDIVLDAMNPDLKSILTLNASQLYLAGGFIRAVLNGEDVADVDIFGLDVGGVTHAAYDYAGWLGSMATVHETPCTLTVEHPHHIPVQFVNDVPYATPAECISQFDFSVCQAVIWWDGTEWCSLCSPQFYQDIQDRVLRYTSPERREAAGGSLWRAFKYSRRGYSISQMTLAALITRLNSGMKKATEDQEDGWVWTTPEVERDAVIKSFKNGRSYC